MLFAMVVVSFTIGIAAQEVRMAVEPKGEVIQKVPPSYSHEPTLRHGDYRISASMAKRKPGFSGNPFSDLEDMEQKIKDALRKQQEKQLAHESTNSDRARTMRKTLEKVKRKWDDTPKSLDEVLDYDEKHVPEKLSNVTCQGPARNITCSFKNLYFESGPEPKWWVFTIKGIYMPDMEGLTFASKYGGPVPIAVHKFEDNAEAALVLKHYNAKKYRGLTLIFSAIWHQNMGHALWDGLYPAYTALTQWGRHDETYRSLVDHSSDCYQANTEDGRCMSEKVFKTFGKGDFISMQHLMESKDQWHVFKEAIAGSGNKGARSINRDYSLPNGNVNDTVRSFRDRMYTSYGLTPPQARTGSAQHRKGGPRSMRGVIVSNSKYSRTEKVMLKSFATVAGSMASQIIQEDGLTGSLNLQYVDYAEMNDFKKHLELIRHTDVHMSAVGTPSCLAPFLSDGSVHINLGNNEWPGGQDLQVHGQPVPYSQGHGVSYMEEYWSEGIPYIRALYYNSATQHLGLKRRELQNLAMQAYKLIHSDFQIPVQPGENLSPVGKTFKEYCYSDHKACEYALKMMNGELDEKHAKDHKDCQTYAYAEMAVFEVGAYGEDGHNGQHCSLHHIEKLRKIRKKYFSKAEAQTAAVARTGRVETAAV